MTVIREAFAGFKARVANGTVLRCIENTYIPGRAGKLLFITKAGVGVNQGMLDGKSFRHEWPKRLGDILDISESRITYRIGKDEHTVTYEIEE